MTDKAKKEIIKRFNYKGYTFRQWKDILYKDHYDYAINYSKEYLTVFRYKKYGNPFNEEQIIDLINKFDEFLKEQLPHN